MKPLSLFLRFVACAAFALLTQAAGASPGDLDTFFGLGNSSGTPGAVVLTGFGQRAIIKSLAVQPDGKIVAAGYHQNSSEDWQLKLTRLLPDGRIDPEFQSHGVTSPGISAIAWDVALQPDGGILVGGNRPAPGIGGSRGILLRFLPDGTRDVTFPGSAFIDNAFGNPGIVFAVTVLNDGRILVAGGTSDYSDQTSGMNVLALLNADGSPDTTFGVSGKMAIPGPGAMRIAVQDDGKILTVGSDGGFTASVTVTRFLAGGTLDTSFGNGGSRTWSGSPGEGLSPGGIATTNGGRIVVAAYTVGTGHNRDFVLLRLLPDGSPDTSFGDSGRVVTDVAGLSGPLPNGVESNDELWELSVEPNGNLLVAGNSNGSAALVRYLPDGALDPGFGTFGIARTRVRDTFTLVETLALQPDGKIITAGFVDAVGMAVFRYQGKGNPPDASMSVQRDGIDLKSGMTIEMGTALRFDAAPREMALSLRNTGTIPLSGITATVLGFGEGHFELISLPGATLSSGHSSTFTLRFTPSREIAGFSDVLLIQSDDPPTGLVFNLHGSTENPIATMLVIHDGKIMDPLSGINFGPCVTGQSISRQFTILNPGNIDLIVQGVTLADTGSPGDYSIEGPETGVLPPDAATSFTVTFSPKGPGLRTARLRIASTDTFNLPIELDFAGSLATSIETWRQTHFGTFGGEGPAADLSDPDQDGIPNILEYATLTDPNESNPPAGVLAKNGDTLEFTITRPAGAVVDLNYGLEWSEDPETGWNTTGVSVSPREDNGAPRQVTFSVSAGSGRRFVRLRVTRRN